jgi:hypothetical protein
VSGRSAVVSGACAVVSVTRRGMMAGGEATSGDLLYRRRRARVRASPWRAVDAPWRAVDARRGERWTRRGERRWRATPHGAHVHSVQCMHRQWHTDHACIGNACIGNACIGHGTPAMAPTQTETGRGPGSER